MTSISNFDWDRFTDTLAQDEVKAKKMIADTLIDAFRVGAHSATQLDAERRYVMDTLVVTGSVFARYTLHPQGQVVMDLIPTQDVVVRREEDLDPEPKTLMEIFTDNPGALG